MKTKFDLIYEKTMRLISEGGLAMQHFLQGDDLEKLEKIKRENVKPTIEFIKTEIFDKLNIPENLWTAELGSVGKKAVSGDIDIAINMPEVAKILNLDSVEDTINFILNKLIEFGFSARRIVNNLHFACPIQGSQLGKLIQVDFFNSVDLDYTKLEKASPSQEESQYKGAHRTMLFRTILKYCSLKGIDEDGEFTAPDGVTYPAKDFKHLLMMDDGFWFASKSWKSKSKKALVNPRKDIQPREFMGRDFQKILDMLFGENVYHVSDLNSFETIWNNILFDDKFPYKNIINTIVKVYYNDLIKNDLVIPQEVTEYMEEHGL